MRGRPDGVCVVQLSPDTLTHALADSDLTRADQLAPVRLPEVFVAPGWIGTWRRGSVQERQDPATAAWTTGTVWDATTRTVVGKAGFRGPPDAAGLVEVGYACCRSCAPGLPAGRAGAPAAAGGSRTAVPGRPGQRQPRERGVVGPLARYGFVQVRKQWDEEDGLELVFEVWPGHRRSEPGTSRPCMAEQHSVGDLLRRFREAAQAVAARPRQTPLTQRNSFLSLSLDPRTLMGW